MTITATISDDILIANIGKHTITAYQYDHGWSIDDGGDIPVTRNDRDSAIIAWCNSIAFAVIASERQGEHQS